MPLYVSQVAVDKDSIAVIAFFLKNSSRGRLHFPIFGAKVCINFKNVNCFFFFVHRALHGKAQIAH